MTTCIEAYNETPTSVAMERDLSPRSLYASPVATEMGVSLLIPAKGDRAGPVIDPATTHLHQRPDNPACGLLGRVGSPSETIPSPFGETCKQGQC